MSNEQPDPVDERSSGGRRRIERAVRRPEAGALAGTLIVYCFFAIFAGGNGFTDLNGTAGWLNQAAELAVVAIPVGMLMIAGEFDLSIASVIGMASLTVSIGSGYYNLPMVVSILIALGLAALVGLLNGLVVVRTGLPSFIVTLASYLAVAGASLTVTRAITKTTTVSVHAHGVIQSLFGGNIFQQFHVSILWAAGMVLLAAYVLTCKPFGNWILATGGDEQAARAAGVPTPRVKVTLFVCTALGAALLGVIQAIEYNGGQVGQGQNFIFDAIIAAVIGGVLLNGGYGSALGIAFGAATYGIVSVGIFYTGWNADLAQVIIGLLVLGAVLANNVLRRLAAAS